MEKARNSTILKILCYILIPILAGIMVLSVIFLEISNEYDERDINNYTETQKFANLYLEFIIGKTSDCINNELTNDFMKVEENGESYYYSNNQYRYNYYNGIGAYINYIMVDKQTNEVFTNIQIKDYEQEIQSIKNSKTYWTLIDGKIDSSIEKINEDYIKYNSIYNYSYFGNGTENILERYDIYTNYDETKTAQITNFVIAKQIYQFAIQNSEALVYIIIISVILLGIIACYLFWAIGHQKGKEGIYLNTIDNIPYEILAIICISIFIISLAIFVNMPNTLSYLFLVATFISYIICYAMCAVMGVTTIKRIKAKKFWKSFLIYKIWKWLSSKIKIFVQETQEKTPESKKIFWYYIGFIGISIILVCMFWSGIAIIGLVVFWIWAYYKIRKYQNQQDTIKQALQDIYNGKENVHINEEELKGTLKEMATYVNDISGGFANAIKESLKSERLKTELITNVSHDIKTPLTSIINYVDLLEKENIQDEKVKEYIEILDNKSQRLKKLTEDLVEASKASSGSVKLNIEEIDIKELINQTIGEFKDRFEQKKLIIETNIPENELKINADNRYMYRIIENLFSNITKYALEGSRVYIDMEKKQNKIKIVMKNISKERLNISSDELMQRFVRGDRSRYTEGSGLGLSIAKSLTELQGGNFDITIDGDLFKVEMEW